MRVVDYRRGLLLGPAMTREETGRAKGPPSVEDIYSFREAP